MFKMGYEALCIPVMGLSHYPATARILMELLPRLLPRMDNEVTSLINMVHSELGNGYDLLWRILELTVPGFDPANPIIILVWSRTYSALLRPSYSTFASKPRKGSTMTIKLAVWHSYNQSTNSLSLIPPPRLLPVSTTTTLRMTMDTSLPTFA